MASRNLTVVAGEFGQRNIFGYRRLLSGQGVPAVKISVAFQTNKPLCDYGPLAARAENLGFDGVTVYNDLFFQPAWLPLLEMARATHWVRLGPAAVNPFVCHPVNIASTIALLDQAARGRAYLGLARGTWLDSIGLEPEKPLRGILEAFECIRRVLVGDRSEYRGQVFHLKEGHSRLRWEGVRADIPFLLGSWGVKTVEACIRLVDEVKLGGSANPAMVQSMRSTMDGAARAVGKSPRKTGLVVGAVTVVDEDTGLARALARREAALYVPVVGKLDSTIDLDAELSQRIAKAVERGDLDSAASLVSDDLLDKVALAGNPRQVAERTLELFQAGADRVEFGTPHGLSENEGLRLLGERVLPLVRRELQVAL